MSKPSLFKYATRELSQDAMICWLLEWAKPEYENSDRNLHLCGVSLIKALISKHGYSFNGDISSLEIKQQYTCILKGKKRSIDILCSVNDEYIILIEDKINTTDGKAKLEDYLTCVKDKFKNHKYIPIYFKTGFQLSFKEVIKAGYREFLREDFLNVLSNYSSIDNDIFKDYFECLSEKENESKDYVKLSPTNWEEWKGEHLQGFYKELHEKLGKGNGGYVHNQNGGFWGFWWHGSCEKYYFQIENVNGEYQLSIKIRLDKTIEELSDCNTANVNCRKKMFRKIRDVFQKEINMILETPSKFAKGQTMTIAVLKDWYKLKEDNTIDMHGTVRFFENLSLINPFLIHE